MTLLAKEEPLYKEKEDAYSSWYVFSGQDLRTGLPAPDHYGLRTCLVLSGSVRRSMFLFPTCFRLFISESLILPHCIIVTPYYSMIALRPKTSSKAEHRSALFRSTHG